MESKASLQGSLSPVRAGIGLLGALASVGLLGEGLAREARPAGFVDAAEMVSGLVVDLRYAGPHNFVGRRIDGYEASHCLLTGAAAGALAAVQDDLRREGFGLKVFDCYRPRRAVAHFVRWARDVTDVSRKAEFYPGIDKRDLFRLGYIAAQSSHSRGSTADLTLVEVESGRELDMGTPFDFFGPASGAAWPHLTAAQRANRERLRAAMARRGFSGYAKEWWHFTLRNEPFPRAAFDFPVR